jgi:hypothetical protein
MKTKQIPVWVQNFIPRFGTNRPQTFALNRERRKKFLANIFDKLFFENIFAKLFFPNFRKEREFNSKQLIKS